MGEIMKMAVEKLLGGRYLVLLMLTSTYCFIMIGCLYLATVGKIDMQFFQGLVTGGLGATLMAVWKDYANRADRGQITDQQTTENAEVKK